MALPDGRNLAVTMPAVRTPDWRPAHCHEVSSASSPAALNLDPSAYGRSIDGGGSQASAARLDVLAVCGIASSRLGASSSQSADHEPVNLARIPSNDRSTTCATLIALVLRRLSSISISSWTAVSNRPVGPLHDGSSTNQAGAEGDDRGRVSSTAGVVSVAVYSASRFGSGSRVLASGRAADPESRVSTGCVGRFLNYPATWRRLSAAARVDQVTLPHGRRVTVANRFTAIWLGCMTDLTCARLNARRLQRHATCRMDEVEVATFAATQGMSKGAFVETEVERNQAPRSICVAWSLRLIARRTAADSAHARRADANLGLVGGPIWRGYQARPLAAASVFIGCAERDPVADSMANPRVQP